MCAPVSQRSEEGSPEPVIHLGLYHLRVNVKFVECENTNIKKRIIVLERERERERERARIKDRKNVKT